MDREPFPQWAPSSKADAIGLGRKKRRTGRFTKNNAGTKICPDAKNLLQNSPHPFNKQIPTINLENM